MSKLKISSPDKPHGTRAVGIVICKERILLMKRIHDGREYYTFPGGGVEESETVEDVVIREILEETNVRISVKRLLYHHDLRGDSDHFFFECEYLAGLLQLGGEELEETRQGDVHQPIWHPIGGLSAIVLYPLEVRDWLIEDLQNGYLGVPKILSVRPIELRN